MAFASRSDLLARCNARRLAQLAVPADLAMVPDEALRVAIAGGDLTGYTEAERNAMALALAAIDDALADADALLISYNVPATAQTTLLARLASTVALYYLQGAERMTDDVRRAYEGVIDTLKAHARGDVSLVPPPAGTPAIPDDTAIITSGATRYALGVGDGGDW